jgi:hypothetical protein
MNLEFRTDNSFISNPVNARVISPVYRNVFQLFQEACK